MMPRFNASLRLLLAALALSAACLSAAPSLAAPPRSGPQRFGDLPLMFEANRGQSLKGIRFRARGSGYGIDLKDEGADLKLSRPGRRPVTLKMRLVGSSSRAAMVGEEHRRGRVNYLRGARSDWKRNIPLYSRARSREVYPGIDLVYYGRDRELEYDFVVNPGGDPRDIALRFDGAESVTLSEEGELLLQTPAGTLRNRKPFLYQTRHGRRKEVSGRYATDEAGIVRFEVGSYDRSLPLVIDPVLSYASYLGGEHSDEATAATADAQGNVYVLLQSETKDELGGKDALVVKLDPSGQLVYASYVGGSRDEYPQGIAVDAQGNVVIAGLTYSEDNPYNDEDVPFPTSETAYSREYGRGFAAQLNAAGDALLYSTFLPSAEPHAVAVDVQGKLYLTGEADRMGFPATLGAYQTQPSDTIFWQAFVMKMDLSRSGAESLVYATYLSGTGESNGYAIAADAEGNAYVAGNASGGYPVTDNAFQTEYKGSGLDGDAFVAKLDPTGSKLLYSTYLGASFYDSANALALDKDANVYVTGASYFNGFPTTANAFQKEWTYGDCGAFDSPNKPCPDAFVAKLNLKASGPASLVYSSYLGGNKRDFGQGIAVDAQGNAYVGGYTLSYQGFPLVDAHQPETGGGDDAFLAVIDPTGSRVTYSTYYGGGDQDRALALARDGQGGVYLVGGTYSQDFPASSAVQEESAGGQDGFIVKFRFEGETPDPPTAPGDVNADGKVNVVDATLTLRIAVKLLNPTPAQAQAADVNADGKVNVTDATLILRKAVGLG